jgi:transposase
MPQELPPGPPVDHQRQRWCQAGVVDALGHDLHAVWRLAQGRKAAPSAASLDSRTLQATPERGTRAGYDGAPRRRGSKGHMAVDTLGHLWALHVTAAREQDRSPGTTLAAKGPAVPGDAVDVAVVDQGYTGERAAEDAQAPPRRRAVGKLPEATTGFVRLPRRGVVERSHAWVARLRRLARAYERLAKTRTGWHVVAFAILMLTRFVALLLHNA